MEDFKNEKSFPVPLWIGWLINIIGWIAFVATMNSAIEFITAAFSLGCVFIGFKHQQAGTAPSFDIDRLSPNTLIYASAIQAIWMLTWATGIVGL